MYKLSFPGSSFVLWNVIAVSCVAHKAIVTDNVQLSLRINWDYLCEMKGKTLFKLIYFWANIQVTAEFMA